MADGENEERSLDSMSFDEISRLSPEAFRALMKAGQKAYYENLQDLGDPLYHTYDLEKKVLFWEGVLNRQMRRQAESGLDEYAIYSPEWYAAVKRQEPVFDEIMDRVFQQFMFSEWDKEEYLKRIGKTVE